MVIRISPKPLTIALHSLKCLDETNELGSDEPYVLVAAADLSGNVPSVEVTSYGHFGDVDTGETRTTLDYPLSLDENGVELLKKFAILRVPFWGIDNESPTVINDPEDVIFVVALMEKDNGNVSAARGIAKIAAVGSLGASTNQTHRERTQKMVADISGVLNIPTGGPNRDDVIGVKPLALTVTDLLQPLAGPYYRNMYFYGGGGHYRLRFEFKAYF